jgi:hypothetical protein
MSNEEKPTIKETKENSLKRKIDVISTDEKLVLDVGGKKFGVWKSTLTKWPNTLLGKMFSQENIPIKKQKDGSYFFDQNAERFEYVLEFHRSGIFPEPSSIYTQKYKQELLQQCLNFFCIEKPADVHFKPHNTEQSKLSYLKKAMQLSMDLFMQSKQYINFKITDNTKFEWHVPIACTISLKDKSKIKLGEFLNLNIDWLIEFVLKEYKMVLTFAHKRKNQIDYDKWPVCLDKRAKDLKGLKVTAYTFTFADKKDEKIN